MKVGLFTALFGDRSIEDVLDLVALEGIEAVELGAGAYPGSTHLEVDNLLESSQARQRLLKQISDRGLILSAISVHGNPLHPNRSIAAAHHDAFIRGVRLADALGVNRLNGFSGCPGDHPAAVNPNWVTCAWPDEFREILDWQWSQCVIPYWTEQASLLAKHRVQFGIEMHPGFVVYANDSLLKLRRAVGTVGEWIGANFDPSHLWWQGVDPLAAVRQLLEERAVFHVHAKDTRIDPQNSAVNGNLDTKSYGSMTERSWVFRSVGYGHAVEWWKDFVSVLRAFGYDHVLSIEHEDGLMSPIEGLRKAVGVLKQAVISEPAGTMFWAKE